MGVSGPSPGSTGELTRLHGLTDHPIPLAEVSALFTFACLALYGRARRPGRKALLALLAIAGAVTAMLTQSRIPVMAMVGAVAAYWAFRRGGALLLAPTLVLCVVVVLMMESVAGFASLLPRDLLEMIARSGSSKEILTLSGRLVIWPFTLERIAEAPWFGHGHASGMTVFKAFTAWKIVHAHNAYLQSLVYVGLLGTAFLAAALAAQLKMFFRRPQAPRDILLLYTLFSGLTEQGMMSNLPSSSGILWMIAAGMAAQAWRRRKAPSTIVRMPLPAVPGGGGPEGQGAQRLGGDGQRAKAS
jgi:O-antigen ligase